jgi:ribonuclease BN (tRNA processing enzyme)
MNQDAKRYNARPPGAVPQYSIRVGQAQATLINGVFGDPLLLLRLRDQRRSLLFDLGEAAPLPGKITHQVTDVFITHAHMDHIAGFLWLLRSRIGALPPCRLYGPPGLASNIQGMLDGVLWDRIADRGPVFIAHEIVGDRMIRSRLRAGLPSPEPMGEDIITDGVIVREDTFSIRAATLDHGTPSIAYSFIQPATLNIRKERLAALGLPSGQWLGELKRRILSGDTGGMLTPPGADARPVAELAGEMVIRAPGSKLVYATDLGDTPQNRDTLIRLAHGAEILFLEATFAEADKFRANATCHLTARACGEIAQAAGAARLAPFHFSRRYERNPEMIVNEIKGTYKGTIMGRGAI